MSDRWDQRIRPAYGIRRATPADAPGLLALKLALDHETDFMLLEPGEREETPDELAELLRRLLERSNSTLLLAQEHGRFLGYVEAEGGRYRRNRHCAQVVIGVRAAASGRGIGTALLHELDTWARKYGVTRLELTVRADNERAIALYRKCGYELEGTRRAAIRLGDTYADEFYTAKLDP